MLHIKKLSKIEFIKTLTRVCDSIVIDMRVRPGSKLVFGWPGPARGENRRRCWKRRCSGQRDRQTLPLVFEGSKLSIQLLKFSVLLSLKGNHLFDVSTKRRDVFIYIKENKSIKKNDLLLP